MENKQETLPSETWCVLPWQGAVIQPWGDVQACCYIDTVRNSNVSDYANTPALLDLKTQLLSGQRPKACAPCWRNEAHGMPSWRQEKNDQIGDRTTLDQKSDVTYWIPDYLEIYISNKCNSKCRMCKPKWSTAWFADYEDPIVKEIFAYDAELETKVVRYNHLSTDQMDQIVDILSKKQTDTTLSLRGGEPFYAEECRYIMEAVLAIGKQDRVHIDISTNGTINDSSFLKLLRRFKSVKLGISIDGSGDLNSYIRGNPTEIGQIYNNVRSYLTLDNIVNLHISNTVQIYNAFDNIALKTQTEEHLGFLPKFDDRLLFNPRHLKLHILPEQYKQHIDNDTFKTAAFTENEDRVLLNKWARWTNALDRLRGESIASIEPRLGTLMDMYMEKSNA
jgi:organic radical activating enzyme